MDHKNEKTQPFVLEKITLNVKKTTYIWYYFPNGRAQVFYSSLWAHPTALVPEGKAEEGSFGSAVAEPPSLARLDHSAE